ncbi:hypothetical protein Trisim1_006199 [Trichoderma cf. simile WF8]
MVSQARREGKEIMAESHRIIAERNAAKEAAFEETLVTPSKNGPNTDVLKNETILPLDGETGSSSSKGIQPPQITQEISDDSSSSDFSSSNDDDYDESSVDDNSSAENDYSGDHDYSNDNGGGNNNDDNDDFYNHDALNDLFPMAQNANVITKQVQKFLKAAYRRESRFWTQDMTKEFKEVAPTLKYEIFPSTGKISGHYICRYANRDGHIWVRFWFLRVMFGPIACSRQPWFTKLAAERPWVLDEADEGIIPEDTASILSSKTTIWTPKTLQKETPTLNYTWTGKRKAVKPMKSSRPTKGTRVSRSRNNQDSQEISRPRARTRASRNRQSSRNASHSTNEVSQSRNETSQSRNEQNPQNIEATTLGSDNQQEFNVPSELEIKLLKQKYGTMCLTSDAVEQRIAQLESENSLLKQEHGTLRSTCNTLEQRTRQLENENRQLKRESERGNERLREEFNTVKLEHAWKIDHLWKRMNQLEQNLPGKE